MGCYIKSMQPIFKTKMFIYQSKANLDEKILFGKISDHLDPKIRKALVSACLGTMIPHSILVYNLLAIEIKVYF